MRILFVFIMSCLCFIFSSCGYIDNKIREDKLQDSINMFSDSIAKINEKITKANKDMQIFGKTKISYDSIKTINFKLKQKLTYNRKKNYSYYKTANHEYVIDEMTGEKYYLDDYDQVLSFVYAFECDLYDICDRYTSLDDY